MSKKNRFNKAQVTEVTESVETETKEFYPGTSVEMTEITSEELSEIEAATAEFLTPEEILVETPEVEAIPTNNFAEAAEILEALGVEPVAPITPSVPVLPSRGVLPDAFGNNIKGQRICSVCGISEAETLAKNPRYSFCKGKCVHCYGKTERKNVKPFEMTKDQIKAKIAYYSDLLAKSNGSQGQPPAGTEGQPEVTADLNVTETTTETSIETSGANLDAKVDELAEIVAE